MKSHYRVSRLSGNLVGILSLVIPCLSPAGEITYPDNSYSSGMTLSADDLNAKFNEIKGAVNDNNTKSTLNDISYSQSSTSVTPDITASMVATTSITPSTDGVALVLFSGYGRVNHTTGSASTIRTTISDSATPSLNGGYGFRFFTVVSGQPTGFYYAYMQSQWVFPVTAGLTYNYYVYTDTNNTTAPALIINHNLSVLFFPG